MFELLKEINKLLYFQQKLFRDIGKNNLKFKNQLSVYISLYGFYNLFLILNLKKIHYFNIVLGNTIYLSTIPVCINNLLYNESLLNTKDGKHIRSLYIEDFDNIISQRYKKLNYLYNNIGNLY